MIKNLFTILLITVTGIAAGGDDHDDAKRLLDRGDILPLENILKQVRAVHSGKVLEVELESEDGQIIYEIELLTTDGNVLELKINAKTAEIISTEKEH